jgi:hypothetical protein
MNRNTKQETKLPRAVIAVMRQATTGRWISVLLAENCLPGSISNGNPGSYCPLGCHSSGFTTREEALAHAERMAKEAVAEEVFVVCKVVAPLNSEWDGVSALPAEWLTNGNVEER